MLQRFFYTICAIGILASFIFPVHTVVAADAQATQKLVAVLQSDAVFYEKARACQQLGEVGTTNAVPALAALLDDEFLCAYARSGLEGIGGPFASTALLNSLDHLKGAQRCGVIISLGVLRDTNAVGVLEKVVLDNNPVAAKEALLALGRISNHESIQFILKTLSDGTPALSLAAAEAGVLAGEDQLKAGHFDVAKGLYDAVLGKSVTSGTQIAAVRGAILSRQGDGPAFLMEQLNSDDAAARLAALTTIREIPGDKMADAINGEISKATPDLQCELLSAMAECHNAKSMEILRAKVADQDANIRKTAINVLGRVGGKAEAGVLLATVCTQKNSIDVELSLASLQQIAGQETDALILEKLSSENLSKTRVQLIHLLANRRAVGAGGELLRQAGSPDTDTAIAALGALSSLAGTNELKGLFALVEKTADPSIRNEAGTTIANICERAGDAGPVLAEFLATKSSSSKLALVRVLTAIGYSKALPEISSFLNGADPNLTVSIVDELSKWPNATPVGYLLPVAENVTNSIVKSHARNAVLHLSMNAMDDSPQNEPDILKWLPRLSANADAREVGQIISLLGRIKQPESFKQLQPFLQKAEFRKEAAYALIQIAPALVKTEIAPDLKVELKKITPDLDAKLSTAATKIAATLP